MAAPRRAPRSCRARGADAERVFAANRARMRSLAWRWTRDELVALARYAAGNLPNDSRLSPCADLDGLPEASFQRLDAWRALAALLLTNDGNWRTRFSKLEGFPSFAAAAPFKQRIVALTDGLRSNEPLRQALHGLRDLPAPHFTPAQWRVLESIVALLPRAAAELTARIRRRGRERLRARDASGSRRAG